MNNSNINKLQENALNKQLKINEIAVMRKEWDVKNKQMIERYKKVNDLIACEVDMFRNELNKSKHLGVFDELEFNQYKTADASYDLKENILDSIIRVKNSVELLYDEIEKVLDANFNPANDLHHQIEDIQEEIDLTEDEIRDLEREEAEEAEAEEAKAKEEEFEDSYDGSDILNVFNDDF